MSSVIIGNTHLTRRELEILGFLVRGYSAKKIGLFLKISNRTVEKYIENVKLKFDCRTKSALIFSCLKHPVLQKNIFSLEIVEHAG